MSERITIADIRRAVKKITNPDNISAPSYVLPAGLMEQHLDDCARLERENAELQHIVDTCCNTGPGIARIKADAYAEAGKEIAAWCKDDNMNDFILQGMSRCATWLLEEALRIKGRIEREGKEADNE